MIRDAHLGEIRIFGHLRPPEGWLPCDGQILQIRDHQALFSLLGTTFGGDGNTTFALPDLRARIPIHVTDSFRVAALVPARSDHYRVNVEGQPYVALAYFIAMDGIFPSQH